MPIDLALSFTQGNFRGQTGIVSKPGGVGSGSRQNTVAHAAVTRGLRSTSPAEIHFQALSSAHFHGYLKESNSKRGNPVYTPSAPLPRPKGVAGPSKRVNEQRRFDDLVGLVMAMAAWPPGLSNTTGRRVFCCAMQNGEGRA
jgi:hypothetical protein